MDDNDDELLKDIAEHGWHAVGYESREVGGSGFAYSVGFFHSFAHPEFFIWGLSSQIQMRLLLLLSAPIMSGNRFHAGSIVPGIANQTLTFVEIRRDFHADYLARALEFYGERHFPALELVWPDPDGNYPWQPDYDYRYEQVLLGTNVV